MRLAALLDSFDLLASAPHAIAKIRTLILEMAVQGRLVPQDRADEPASMQLEKIAGRKIQAGRPRRVRKSTAAASASEKTDRSVPDGWAVVELSELVTVLNGRAYSKDELLDAGTPVLRVGNLFTSKDWYYSNLSLEPEKYCAQGDLIFAWSASFGPFIWPGPKVIYHYHIWKLDLHCEDHLSKSYLYWFLQNKTQEIKRAGHGVSMLHMTKEKMEKLRVMVPPLAEQKRIVAKVDELMALCDRLEAQQLERETQHAALARAALARFADDPTPDNLTFLFHSSYSVAPEALRKCILKLAVQGKLSQQDPSDEAPELSFPALAAANLDPDRSKAPFHWLKVPLGEIGEWRGGGTPSKSRPDYWIGQIPWVSPKDMKVLLISNAQDHISGAAVEGSSVRMIPRGSLLMVVRGMILARAFPVALTLRDVTINQDMKALLPFEPEIAPYLLLALRAIEPDILAAIEHSTHGTCKLETDVLHAVGVPIPPLAEQHRIVAKVDQLMALVDQLEAQLTESKAKAQKLLDAVIHELLNPRADIIEFPRSRQNRVWERAAIGCYIIQRMAGSRHFGKVMLMKLFYLAENHTGGSFDGEFARQAAGPWDPWIDQFEDLGKQNDWFDVVSHKLGNGHIKYEYRAKAGLENKAGEAPALLGDQHAEFDRVLGLFADKTTEEAEIIATLFAVWNDALIDEESPTDDSIKKEVRENWHPEKARFKPPQLDKWLEWLRAHRLVPRGCGRRTVQQNLLPLH